MGKQKQTSVLVSFVWDNSDLRSPLLIVGEKRKVGRHVPDIVNSVQGERALKIMRELCGEEFMRRKGVFVSSDISDGPQPPKPTTANEPFFNK